MQIGRPQCVCVCVFVWGGRGSREQKDCQTQFPIGRQIGRPQATPPCLPTTLVKATEENKVVLREWLEAL